jgi:hypothetical protein
MKQSFDGLSSLRLLSRKLVISLAAAAAIAAAACGGTTNDTCPNLPIANGLIGQTTYLLGNGNIDGISASTVSGPLSMALAPSGSATAFYVADTNNNRVLGYTAAPGFTNTLGITTPPPATSVAGAASFELGQGSGGTLGTDFTDADPFACANNVSSPTCPIGLANPTKVSVSNDGQYLVVADSGNNRVLIWGPGNLPTAGSITQPTVVVGQPDFQSRSPNQNIAVAANTLFGPNAAVINDGVLVVADTNNNRVLIWTTVPTTNNQPANIELGQAPTQTTTTTSGTTTVGCTSNTTAGSDFCFTSNIGTIDSFSSINNNYTLAMNQPTDVYTNGVNLVVSDTLNNRVLYWKNIPTNPTEQDQIPQAVIGQTAFAQNTSGSGTQHMFAPTGVGYDGTNIYVADTQNNRVLLFQETGITNGTPATGVFGQQDFAHVQYNDDDQNNIAGDQQNNQTNDNPTQNTLHLPQGVFTVLGAAQVFIADSGNSRILQFPIDTIQNNTEVDGYVNGSYPNNCNGINPQV